MASKRKADQQKLRTVRRTLVLTYLTAALILLPLALIRQCDSRVVADVTVRGLVFDFAGTSVLIDSRTYPSVHVVQSARAELRLGDRIVLLAISPEGSMTIERPHLGLQIERGARVSLAHNDASTLALSVSGGAAAAELTVPRQATIECEYCNVDGAAHDRYVKVLTEGGTVKLHGEESRLHLLLETDGTSMIEDDDLPIINPAFLPGSAEAPTSNVVGDGKVTLSDVQGFDIQLQRGEMVAFGQPHDFRITRIEMTPDGLHIVMNGRVREIRRGAPNERSESQMPSLLQRLHANQAVALYFAAVLLIAGTVFNVFRQLKMVREPK
jgi:hypothetical protein